MFVIGKGFDFACVDSESFKRSVRRFVKLERRPDRIWREFSSSTEKNESLALLFKIFTKIWLLSGQAGVDDPDLHVEDRLAGMLSTLLALNLNQLPAMIYIYP